MVYRKYDVLLFKEGDLPECSLQFFPTILPGLNSTLTAQKQIISKQTFGNHGSMGKAVNQECVLDLQWLGLISLSVVAIIYATIFHYPSEGHSRKTYLMAAFIISSFRYMSASVCECSRRRISAVLGTTTLILACPLGIIAVRFEALV